MQHKCLFCMSDHIKVIGTRSFSNLLTFSVWLALLVFHLIFFPHFFSCFSVAGEKKGANISKMTTIQATNVIHVEFSLVFPFFFSRSFCAFTYSCLLNSNLTRNNNNASKHFMRLVSRALQIKCNNFIVVVIAFSYWCWGEIFKEWYHRFKGMYNSCRIPSFSKTYAHRKRSIHFLVISVSKHCKFWSHSRSQVSVCLCDFGAWMHFSHHCHFSCDVQLFSLSLSLPRASTHNVQYEFLQKFNFFVCFFKKIRAYFDDSQCEACTILSDELIISWWSGVNSHDDAFTFT